MQAEICLRANKKGKVPCILVHREEILRSTFKTLMKFGIQPELIVPGRIPHSGRPVYLGMVETFNRRMAKGILDRCHIDFFQMDEAHWGSYPKIIDQLNQKILGWTATPKSSGTGPELREQYGGIVTGIKLSELIEMNRLCPGYTYSIKHDFSKVKKKGKDYDDNSLLAEFKKAKLYDGAVKKYFELCPDTKAIFYNVNIQHSLDVMQQLRERGVKNLYHVDGQDSFKLYDNGMILAIDREQLFREFDEHKHAVMCNVGVATTGTDIPSVRTIVENFATMSITKAWQVRGRGGRTLNEQQTSLHGPKSHFNIIDMGRNWLRHGRYGQDIDWEEIFNNPSKADAKNKPNKRDQRECEECTMVIPMRCKCCPYCDALYSDAEIDKFLLDGATLEEIKQHKIDTLPVHLRKDWRHMDLTELLQYGRHMGYRPTWARTVWSKKKENRTS